MTDDRVYEEWLCFNPLSRCAGRRSAMTLPEGKISSAALHFLCNARSEYALLRSKKNLGPYLEQFGYQFAHEKVLSLTKPHLGIANVEEAHTASQQEYLTKRF